MWFKRPRLRIFVALATVATVVAAGSAAAVVYTTQRVAGSAGGITVHGRWTIKVYGKHHRLLRVRRFENSLQDGGTFILANLLTGNGTADGWGVGLTASDGTTIAFAGTGSAESSPDTPPLTVSTTTNGSANGVQMTGTAPARMSATISQVHTEIELRATDGVSFYSRKLTARTLNPTIPVQTGQTITINVQLSFS